MCLATAARTPDVDRKAAESRVLTGLHERMMTLKIAVDL
jgi:hypothetical protein